MYIVPKKYCFSFLLLALFVSCGRTSPVGQVPLRLEKPRTVLSLDRDTTFRENFPELLHCVGLQVVADSLLVCQDVPGVADSNLFKVYALRDSRYLGSFGKQGRGPGEWLSPRMGQGRSGTDCLQVGDIARGAAFRIDVSRALAGDRDGLVQDVRLPASTVDWTPLSESSLLSLNAGPEELLFHTVGREGRIGKTFHLYDGINGGMAVSKLSSVLIGRGTDDRAAILLMCFPQMILLDTGSGAVWSVAVDKAARNWDAILSSPFGPDSFEYYTGVTATPDLILASYSGCSIGALMAGGSGGAIHIFDWDGNFLYDLRVRERVGGLAYDAAAHFLYGIEQNENRIVRYDLSAAGL